MIKKKTIHQHLLGLGFTFLNTVHRHNFYSRVEDNGNRIEVSVYRTTLFMTHVYITIRDSEGGRLHSRFANLKSNSSLNVIDRAIEPEESLVV